MLVLELRATDRNSVVDALDCYCDAFGNMLKDVGENNQEEMEELEKQTEYTKGLYEGAKSMALQELAERCMSYFWDMYKDMGGFCDELEELREDMGLEELELVELFRKAGFE